MKCGKLERRRSKDKGRDPNLWKDDDKVIYIKDRKEDYVDITFTTIRTTTGHSKNLIGLKKRNKNKNEKSKQVKYHWTEVQVIKKEEKLIRR